MDKNNLPTFLKTDLLINGAWIKTASRFDVINPATKTKITDVANATASDAVEAILSAHKAQQTWANLLVAERAAILMKWHDLIIEHKESLARLMTVEQGKPLREARAEIGLADNVRWAVEESYRMYGKIVPPYKANTRAEIRYEPVGVVAAITPWNFPHSMITRKVAPALAAGCAVVLKPAEDTPLSALALASLAIDAGMPAGVFNVIPCARSHVESVGAALTDHPLVRKLSFTGSTAVGKSLMERAAKTVKKISLELGGNAPFIITASADLELAIDGAMASKFRNAGQTCICANRIFVESSVFEQVKEKFKSKLATMKVGDGLDEATIMGPLINERALDKINHLKQDALDKGANLTEMSNIEGDGYFCAPTIIDNITPSMRIAHEEIFGPLLTLIPFDTIEDAIAHANDTEYGLAAFVYTNATQDAQKAAAGLKYGMVGVNDIGIAHPTMPFGGVKESGMGREGGPDTLHEFMDIKAIITTIGL